MRLKAPSNKVIIKVDLESKNSHTFKDGTKIKLEKNVNRQWSLHNKRVFYFNA